MWRRCAFTNVFYCFSDRPGVTQVTWQLKLGFLQILWNPLNMIQVNHSFTLLTGLVRQGTSTCLCVAVKRTIMVFEINRTRQRHRRVKEIQCPGTVQYIEMMNERLIVGYPSSFAVYSVQGDAAPIGMVTWVYLPTITFYCSGADISKSIKTIT